MCSKVDNHLHEKTLFCLYSLKKFAQIEFSAKSLTLSCLISALNLYFAQKLLRKAKKLLELLQKPKCAQKLPSTIGRGLDIASLVFAIYGDLNLVSANIQPPTPHAWLIKQILYQTSRKE